MAWLEDIIFVLEENDVAVRGTDLFASSAAHLPKLASGEAVLVVVDTGGTSPMETQNLTTRPAYLQPTAQISARAPLYSTALAKAQAAWNALYAVRNRFIGSGDTQPWYLWIRPLQNPTDLGVDQQGNVKVGFNVSGRMRP